MNEPRERTHPRTIREALERGLVAIPGVERRPSRYGDGLSYFTGAHEIAHFHGDRRLDVRLARQELRELRAEGPIDQRLRTRGRVADWAEIHLAEVEEIPFALMMFERAVRANS
jgi:hypothetical protein